MGKFRWVVKKRFLMHGLLLFSKFVGSKGWLGPDEKHLMMCSSANIVLKSNGANFFTFSILSFSLLFFLFTSIDHKWPLV